jgi:DnaJ-class molecular chaperone
VSDEQRQDASGRDPFSAYEADCPMCGGQGVVPGDRDSFGNYDTDECPDCGGDGTVLIVAGVPNGEHEDLSPDVHDDPSWSPESASRFA